jgi:carbon-monoxide dehydrogenase large subunit
MTTTKYVGSRIARVFDVPMVTGRAIYASDVSFPSMCHIALVRSPYAHARIERIDISEALRVPGVLSVFTGEDVKDFPIKTLVDETQFRAPELSICALAVGKARFAGEPVAAVVAEQKNTATMAAQLVNVDYTPLQPIVDPVKAMDPASPKLYDQWDSNLFFQRKLSKGDVDAGFKSADRVIRGSMRINPHGAIPMEPRSYAADYNPISNTLLLYSSTQMPHTIRLLLSKTLKLPETSIRVIQPNVGGAFGVKAPFYQDEVLIPLLSLLTKRPLKWTEDRREHFALCANSRNQIHDYEVAFKNDGTITGIKDRIIADVGVLFPQEGWGMPLVTLSLIPTVYKIANVEVELNEVVTNKAHMAAYRGYGKECATFFMERLMDIVARETGVDRPEIRFRHFIQPNEFPFALSENITLDSGDYPAAMKKALDILDYQHWKEEKKKARKEGRFIGVGIAYELEPEGACIPSSYIQQYDGVTMRVSPTGDVTVLTGITSPGSGNETAIAQIAADELGVSIENVHVIQGDTAICPFGLGNFAGRSMLTGGPATVLAAREIRDKMQKLAAIMLEASPDDIESRNGFFYVRGAERLSLAFSTVSETFHKRSFDLAIDLEPGLEVTKYWKMPNARNIADEKGKINIYSSYANAAHACAVEVDVETGIVKFLKYVLVDDAGNLINPIIVEGQLQGGLVQGIGGTLYEQTVYSEDGQVLSSTFMDYLIPTSMEAPHIDLSHQVTPSPYTPLGAKGVGESGIVGAAAAIVGAVEDALSEFDVRITSTPIRPNQLWQLVRASKMSKLSHGKIR